MQTFFLRLNLATLHIRFYQTPYSVDQLPNDRVTFESNKLLTDNFWTPIMIDSAN
jgi:hypothetical protein